MSAQELDVLWTPTFGPYDRWICFISSPIIIFLLNLVVNTVANCIFSLWFVSFRLGYHGWAADGSCVDLPGFMDNDGDTCATWAANPTWCYGSPEDGIIDLPSEYANADGIDAGAACCVCRQLTSCPSSSSVCIYTYTYIHTANATWQENILWYFFSCTLLKEIAQAVFITGIKKYWDRWNALDLTSAVTFLLGYYLRTSICAGHEESPWCQLENVPISTAWEAWSFAYSLCLFFCWLRLLRALFLVDYLANLTLIFWTMIRDDVVKWLAIYVILYLSSVMLVLGVADRQTLILSCEHDTDFGEHSSDLYMQCANSRFYLFFRTIFQSFGELFLEDARNEMSIVVIIFLFLVFNIVMLNLLIAQMSNTYSNLMANSRPDIIREHFELADEYSRRFIAWPVPLNVILLPIEIVYFLREYKALTCRYPDNTYWQRLDMFLARNISPSEWVEWGGLSTSAAGKAHNLHKAKLESCMERARDRALYINERGGRPAR